MSLVVHAREGAGPGAPAVVFVHGSMDRGAAFAGVCRHLPDLAVVRYDRRGYGRSRRAAPLAGLAGHVDDLLGLLAARPAVVVGHSLGGVVAASAAARQPDLVRALVVFEPPLPWRPWWPHDPAPAADPGDEAAAARAAEAFLRRMLGDERWEALSPRTREERRADGPAFVDDARALRRGGAAFDPAALAVPVVAGRGARSAPALRRASAEVAEEAPDGELVELDDAGHGAHLGAPAAFADLVRRAVERAGDRDGRAGAARS